MNVAATKLLTLPALSLLCAASASAQVTWVVDDDGGVGVDFTDIQPAVDAASSGDLIDVRRGDYGGFTVDISLRIMGADAGFGGTKVEGVVLCQNLPSDTWSVLADMRIERVHLESCAGTVLLDGVSTYRSRDGLRIVDCSDVRARGLQVRGGGEGAGSLCTVRDSRFQVADSRFLAPGADYEEDGGAALWASGAAFVHATDCEFVGGNGGDRPPFLFSYPPGDGGPAMRLDPGSELRLVRSSLVGGGPGFDPNVVGDGYAGVGLDACGGLHRVFESSVLGGDQLGSGFHGPGDNYALACGASVDTTTPTPSMTQVGVPVLGATVTLETRSDVGDSLRILFGRFPVKVLLPGVALPRLVDVGRLGSLGAVPGTGVVSIDLTIPAWPRGTVAFLQASKTDAAGVTDFTNAIALVVR